MEERLFCGQITDRAGKTEVIEGGGEMFRSLRLGKKGRKSKHGKTILKLEVWKVGICI